MASWVVSNYYKEQLGHDTHQGTNGAAAAAAILITWQIRLAELMAYVAVAGAFLVLWNQVQDGVQMDGLSGIDIHMCKARQAFELEVR